MIDVKILSKPKKQGGSAGSSSKTTYIQGTISEAEHATRADKAKRAEAADQADYATRAGAAQTANFAQKAGELDEEAEVLQKFLRKDTDDTAQGIITFLKGLRLGDTGNNEITAEGLARLYAYMTYGFNSGLNGNGASIDHEGNAEFDSLFVRKFISTPKFVFNEVNVTKAEQWNTNGYGTIESIDTDKRQITLKLEENDYGSLMVGDICRGIFADIDNAYGSDDTEEGALDDCNFVTHKGFFTSYFYVRRIITNEKGKFVFEYGKRSAATPAPCAFMDFAQYGSFTDEQRQSSMYFSSRGRSYIEVLDGVTTWEIQPENRVCRYGWLGGLSIKKRDGSYVYPTGNGIYVQDNVYFGGTVQYLGDIAGLEDLKDEAKAYDVSLSQYQSVITVDDMGNVINGLYTEDEGKTSKQYRIATAVFVRKGTDILLEEDAQSEDVTAGHYRLQAVSEDCEVKVENSTIFVTAIRNIKDGVAGTADDTTFDYEAMRKMSDAMVTIVVELEGKTSKLVQMPIRIQHDSLPFMVCDLSNESASVAWNTKAQKYIGLPITTKVSLMYHNEPYTISSLNISKVNGLKTSMSIDGKAKVITIEADGITSDSLAQVTKLDITVVGRYAGANYEYTKELTILKSADTVVYEVIPSSDSIVVDKDGNKSANSVSCDVYATSSDDKRYKLSSLPSGFTLRYGKGNTPTTAVSLGSSVAVSADDKMVTFGLYDASGNVLDKESVPVLAYGKDGKGIEYVYYLSSSATAPSNPTPSNWETSSSYQSTTSEYIPSGWTDDPSGVTAVKQYEYVAVRKSVNGKWQPFSAPAEYAHFGKHAPKAKVDDDIITIPTDSQGNALLAFSELIHFDLNVDGRACTLTSVTKDSDTLNNVSCSISSSNVATISCSDGAKLGKTAQTIVFRVTGTLDGASYTDYVTVKVVPNVTGEDGDGYEYVYYLSSSATAPTAKPYRSTLNGTLGNSWQDDPPAMTDTYRYIYISYRRGEPYGASATSEWSTPRLWAYKAKDGVGIVASYQRAASKPTSKPSTTSYDTYKENDSLGNGWTKSAPTASDNLVSGGSVSGVSYNNNASGGDWTSGVSDGGYSWYKSPTVAGNGIATMRIYFTTSVDNQYVTFYLKAYSEVNWDFVLISEIDSSTISRTSGYSSRTSGNGVEVSVKLKCGSAGQHFVTVAYAKDGTTDANGDYGLVRMATTENYIKVESLLYRCDGSVEEGVITWGDIYQAQGNKGEQGEQGEQGEKGEQGTSVTKVETYYAISSSSTSAPTSGWTTSMQNPTKDKQYLWSYTKTLLDNGTSSTSTPVVIGNYTEAGPMGTNGCIVRTSIWASGVEYRNDSALTTDGVKYLDVVYVEDSSANGGYALYQCVTTHTSSGSSFTYNTTNWKRMSDFGPIYAPLIVAKNAVLRFAQSQRFIIEDQNDGKKIVMQNGMIDIFGTVNSLFPNIRFGVDDAGYAIMSYYDNDGNLLYDLGPSGLDAKNMQSAKLETMEFVLMSTVAGTSSFGASKTFSDGNKYFASASQTVEQRLFPEYNGNILGDKSGATPASGYTAIKLYRYTAARMNNTIVKDDAHGLTTAELAQQANGKYFTSSSVMASGGSLTNLATGTYIGKKATVKLNVTSVDGGNPKYQLAYMEFSGGAGYAKPIYSLEENDGDK